MTRAAKRAEERQYLEWLAELYPPLRGLRLDALEPPEPDYVAQSEHGPIGIEVTEFYNSRVVRQKEGEEDGILTVARTQYDSSGLPPVRVVLYWSKSFIPSKGDRQLGPCIASLVASRTLALGERLVLDREDEATEKALDFAGDAIDRLEIDRIIDYQRSEWVSPRSWWAASAGPEAVQAEIDRKNPKPVGYRKQYQETWLVLIHHGSQPSSGFDISEGVAGHRYDCKFDRVLLFSRLLRSVIELKGSSRLT